MSNLITLAFRILDDENRDEKAIEMSVARVCCLRLNNLFIFPYIA